MRRGGGGGGGVCRRAAAASSARPMLPAALAPLDPHKTRALTTIYAQRKQKSRKNKTAQNRMLENDLPIKTTLSPFHPLPAIGQKLERSKTKVIVFDLDRTNSNSEKEQDVFKPLTPLRIHGFTKKKSLEHLEHRKPQQLIRENTYDVIDPIYVHNKDDADVDKSQEVPKPKDSPKTRFKKAAIQVAKLSALPETGKLLCMRERETFNICPSGNDSCRLEKLPQSPEEKLNKLSEIFQSLEMKGRHRDRMKKENSWF